MRNNLPFPFRDHVERVAEVAEVSPEACYLCEGDHYDGGVQGVDLWSGNRHHVLRRCFHVTRLDPDGL